MSDELTKEIPNDVPDTEPTILTLMQRLRVMQEVMDRRHIETLELITGVRGDVNEIRGDVNEIRGDVNEIRGDVNEIRGDVNGIRDYINGIRNDINQRMEQKHELLVNRIDLLRAETDAHFRKQGHVIRALNDAFLETRGDHRELFERIAVLEEKAP